MVRPGARPSDLDTEIRENIVAAFGIVPILPALRIRCVGNKRGLCGFFVARITKIGRLLI
jgi:hypothetical protein